MPTPLQPTADDFAPAASTFDYLHWDSLPDEVLTACATVEQVLKISPTTRWRLEKTGSLPGYQLGSSKRYRVSDVRKLICAAQVAA